MKRRRVVMVVRVDLDPIPGSFNTAQDHVNKLQRMLDNAYQHYNPEVTLDYVTEPVEFPNDCCTYNCLQGPHCLKEKSKHCVKADPCTASFTCAFHSQH
jgi:hypothetical protein